MTSTCKCIQCYGLREELERYGLNTRGIPAAPGCPSQTMPLLANTIVCEGTYTCICPSCTESNNRLKAHRAQYKTR